MSAFGSLADMTSGADDNRLTAKADFDATQTNVRFVPIADIAVESPFGNNQAADHGGPNLCASRRL